MMIDAPGSMNPMRPSSYSIFGPALYRTYPSTEFELKRWRERRRAGGKQGEGRKGEGEKEEGEGRVKGEGRRDHTSATTHEPFIH